MSSVAKIIPIIVILAALVAGVAFAKQRINLKQRMDDLLKKANQQATTPLPTPTEIIPFKKWDDGSVATAISPSITVTPTPTSGSTSSATPTPTPTKSTEKTTKTVATSKGGKTTTTKTYFVCTPVYGMANSCAEHTIVDTGLDTAIFMNLAGASYLGGLFAFVKAKRRA